VDPAHYPSKTSAALEMAARDGVILQGNSAPPRVQHNQQQQRSSLDLTVDCSTLVSPSQLKKRLSSVQPQQLHPSLTPSRSISADMSHVWPNQSLYKMFY
jgi:hypothetical protein